MDVRAGAVGVDGEFEDDIALPVAASGNGGVAGFGAVDGGDGVLGGDGGWTGFEFFGCGWRIIDDWENVEWG